jgi:hypothetical protein
MSLLKNAPKKQFVRLSDTSYFIVRNDKANHLGAKMRELIALPVVTARCDGCIATVDAALKEGATRKKIAEAQVLQSLNAGAALVYSRRRTDSTERRHSAPGKAELIERTHDPP